MSTFTQLHVPNDSGCSTWIGKRDTAGYGVWPTPRAERPYWITVEPRAASWVVAWRYGLDHPDELPKGHDVEVSCGNRLCVASEHIAFLSKPVEEDVPSRMDSSASLVVSIPMGTPRTRSTECERGHAYADHGKLAADGYYRCRLCRSAATAGRSKRPSSIERPCRNGHDVTEKRQSWTSQGRLWTYCAACRRESTRERNALRRVTPECLHGHDRTVHGYRDRSGSQRCHECERTGKRRRKKPTPDQLLWEPIDRSTP